MKPLNIKSNTLVKVIWFDSSFEMGWQYVHKPILPEPVVTVGFVTDSGKAALEIASTMGMFKGGRLNPLVLPWGMVLRVERLYGNRQQRR